MANDNEQNNENKQNLQDDPKTDVSTGENNSNDYSQEQNQIGDELYTQLEQRITSIEQRLQSVEHVEQPQSKPNDDEQTTNNQDPENTDNSSDSQVSSDNGNDLAKIEKMLDL